MHTHFLHVQILMILANKYNPCILVHTQGYLYYSNYALIFVHRQQYHTPGYL